MKKILSFILILLLALTSMPVYAAEENSTAIKLQAESAILMDMTTGKVLYEKNADQQAMPASLVKMMTAVIILENLDLGQDITVSEKEIANVSGNKMDLLDGEILGAGIILSAMMMSNANDAAVVLANRTAGSTDAFVKMMNDKAAELGCAETNFTNVTGEDDSNQYTTARDLSIIARYCMKNETFARVAAKTSMSIMSTNVGPVRNISNLNLLLYDETPGSRVFVNNVLRFCKYEGCIGIQSGYSDGAGACLASAVTQQGTTLLAIVLGSGASERYSDSIQLYDYGFANYKTVRFNTPFVATGTIPVVDGEFDEVSITSEALEYVTIPADASANNVVASMTLNESVQAPCEKGTKVGVMVLDANGVAVAECDIVTAEDALEGNFFQKLDLKGGRLIKFILICVLIVAAIAGAIAAYVVIDRKRTIKRKADRAIRRAEAEARDAALMEAWEKLYKYREENDEISIDAEDIEDYLNE